MIMKKRKPPCNDIQALIDENKRLREALENIIKHNRIIATSFNEYVTTTAIAQKALKRGGGQESTEPDSQ